MFDDDYKESDYYDKADDGDEDEFNGFSIVDDTGMDIAQLKKIVREAEDAEEPTIATPVPENEAVVIIDVTAVILPNVGEELDIKLSSEGGGVFLGKMEVGRFKAAFIKRIYETRKGCFVRAYLHSDSSPVMVKLIFSDTDGVVIA